MAPTAAGPIRTRWSAPTPTPRWSTAWASRLGRGRHRGGGGDARPAGVACSSRAWSASSSPARCPTGTTATDLVLTITELLRRHGVVGKFVEFYGPGVAAVPLENRATIGNMSPEYGSTVRHLPDRRRDAAVPAAHRPPRRAGRAGRGVRQGAGAVARPRRREPTYYSDAARAGPVDRGAVASPGPPARRTVSRSPTPRPQWRAVSARDAGGPTCRRRVTWSGRRGRRPSRSRPATRPAGAASDTAPPTRPRGAARRHDDRTAASR